VINRYFILVFFQKKHQNIDKHLKVFKITYFTGNSILGKKILIIEDEQEFFFFYTIMLEDTDYTIIRAIDGEQAFEKIEKDKPDLIILDLLLDQLTGDTFLQQLKSNPKYVHIPIIIASSFSPRSYKTILELDPNLTFLEKPFTQEKLLMEIRAKLE
jgi:DNA-binding response OmpR family regulator